MDTLLVQEEDTTMSIYHGKLIIPVQIEADTSIQALTQAQTMSRYMSHRVNDAAAELDVPVLVGRDAFAAASVERTPATQDTRRIRGAVS